MAAIDDALAARPAPRRAFRDRMGNFVEHGLLIDAFAREAGWIEHLGEVAPPIAAPSRGSAHGNAPGERPLRLASHTNRKSPRPSRPRTFGVVPAVIVETSAGPNLPSIRATAARKEIEACGSAGPSARTWGSTRPAGIVLLALQ